jgi:formate dehydrogenase subunit gamma
MVCIRDLRVVARLVVFFCLALPLPGLAQQQGAPAPGAAQQHAQEQVKRQESQPLNNAPVWRDVRNQDSTYQTTQVRGVETNVLVQSQGETWRQIRPVMSLIGGIIIAVALLGLFGYYRWRGPIGLHGKPTGRLIQRFSDLDRAVHWTMAISFVLLMISGLIITFGKYLLLPLFGYTLFSWLAILSKNLHNFVAPVFFVSLPVFIVLFIRDNLPRAYDINWLKTFGGMLNKHGAEVPSGRFNAGEKALFWSLVCFFSVVLCLSGVVLLFPNFDQGRQIMQSANVVHAVCALLAIAMACFHMYLGTIGMKGAYDAMRTGYVDETWAKEHHEIWYDEVKAGTSRQHFADDVPADARARVEEAIRAA